MISYHLIAAAAMLVTAARAGVLLPSKPGPAYSSSVFSQTFSRQDEPVQYVAQFSAPAPSQLASISVDAAAVPQYVAQVPAGVQPVTYVTGYQAPSPPISTVAYVRSAADKTAVPKYEYAYLVIDPVTGDQKSQQESRSGDAVRGEYALVQPDGSLRRVAYTADDYSGFNAVIRNYAPLNTPYDPCQNQGTIQTTTTATTVEPRSKGVLRDCGHYHQADFVAEVPEENSNAQVTEKGQVIGDDKPRARSSVTITTTRDDSNKGIGQRELEKGAIGSTEIGQSPSGKKEISVINQDDLTSRAGRKEVTLSYDDIIRCLKAQMRGNIVGAQEGNQEFSAGDSELAVLPASRSAIAYVATPFIFPTPNV